MAEFFKTRMGAAIKQVAVILLASAILSLADGLIRSEASLAEKRLPPLPRTEIATALEDQSKGVAFVDARPAARFNEGHIPGAINLDLHGGPPTQMTDFRKKVAFDKAVIVYSDAAAKDAGTELARKLREIYFNTTLLSEGLEGWVKRDGPITKEKP